MRFPEDSDEITEVKDLFVYHIFGEPRSLRQWQARPEAYSLEVRGLVARPQSWTLAEIRESFEPVSAAVVLQCMTRVHWGRIRVKGVRLQDLLKDAKPKSDAKKIAFSGGEGFTTDLSVEEVGAEPDRFILAYEMNGQPLTADHGYPLRVVAEGKYAYKWCKWLTAVELTDRDFKGHYEGKRGWSDRATRGLPVL
jgi:DMSO/TMAO reductase YedYZ molybdopterin-dependent catalytic subunit